MAHMHWRSFPSRSKNLEKNRLVPIALLHPTAHLRTSQTVSRNSPNFTAALHRQEKTQQQSLTHEETSLTHHHVINAHTQRTRIFYNSPEGGKIKKNNKTQTNKTLSRGVGPEFSISEHLWDKIYIAKTTWFLVCFHRETSN